MNRLVLPVVLLLAALVGPRAAVADTLSVVTLNIWHDQRDWPKRMAVILEEFRRLGPDVICLQEVLQHENLRNQAETLADSLGYRVHFTSVDSVHHTKRYGNAILTRHPVLRTGGRNLEPADDYRTVAHVRIDFGGRAIDVYDTHLHHTPRGGKIRATQIADLLAFVDSTRAGDAVVLAGDFNAELGAREMRPLLRGHVDAFRAVHPKARRTDAATYGPVVGSKPRAIDHVFVPRSGTPRLVPRACEILFGAPGADGVWASDHFAVAAWFEIEGPGTSATGHAETGGAGATPSAACDMTSARPWIARWFAAWELTAREILRLPDAPAPGIVFYDSACVYTTTAAAAPGAPVVDGPALLGETLAWRAVAHGDSLTMPDGSRLPVALMSFANHHRESGPYFVMAAPSYWKQRGIAPEDDGPAGVFIHEFAHTRQIPGVLHVIGPIDSAWAYPEELSDDAVQTHFGADSAYVAAYLAERDLLYRAAGAGSDAEARALAAEALALMQRRHARWFTGDQALFATLDDLFLSMEGAAQWAAVAWLAHPGGGGLTHAQAVAKMLGRRRWWVQDHGLAVFLVIDRLVPDWPRLVFAEPSAGALELLERAAR